MASSARSRISDLFLRFSPYPPLKIGQRGGVSPPAPPKRKTPLRPPDTRKHTVLPVSIRLKSTEKTPACVSMWAFLQPISARIYFGKTASHRKRARFVQSRGASPQAYWMSVKAAQRRGCAKRAFCGVCFLMPGGLKAGRCLRVDKPHAPVIPNQ